MTAFSHPDRPFEREDLLDDPIVLAAAWLAEAEAAGIPLANAIALATADADGPRPSATCCSARSTPTGSCSSRTAGAARAGTSR